MVVKITHNGRKGTMNFRYIGLVILLSGAQLFAAQAEGKQAQIYLNNLARAASEMSDFIDAMHKAGANTDELLINAIKWGGDRTNFVATKLLTMGANADIRYNLSSEIIANPLWSVVNSGRAQLLPLLISKLKDKSVINEKVMDKTPLMEAALHCPECILPLIQAGADLFVKNDAGKTALDYAQTPETKKLLSDYMQAYRRTMTESVHAATPLEKNVSGLVTEYVVGAREPKKAEPKKPVPAPKQEQGKGVNKEGQLEEVD